MKRETIIELADTSTAQQGIPISSDSDSFLGPRIWLKDIIDAAKYQLYATQFAYQTTLQKGQKDVTIPRRTKYLVSGSSGTGSAPENQQVASTTLDTLSGVTMTPGDENYAVYLSNRAVRTFAVDIVRAAKEDLSHWAGDHVDKDVVDELISDSNKAGSAAYGSQAIYGGDATDASELTTNDVITTDHVAEAKRKLQSTSVKYWTYGTGESTSSDTKNPWTNEPNAPFVLMIAAEQEEVFLTDSQFVNAAEYGSAEVVRNGEIGKYLGVKVVVSPNAKSYAASATHADASTTAVAQHRCAMFKAQKAYGIAWGQKPRLHIVPYPSNLQTRIILEQSYKAKQIHSDAIVHINVADE